MEAVGLVAMHKPHASARHKAQNHVRAPRKPHAPAGSAAEDWAAEDWAEVATAAAVQQGASCK